MKRFLTLQLLRYLRFWARKAIRLHDLTVIGVAGSVGKSSTRNAIEAIIKDHFPAKSIGNSETGIPLGILGIRPKNYSTLDWLRMSALAPFRLNHLKDTTYLIVEMGIDDPEPPKNMDYLLTILKPHIAVSLNVSATHSQQFDRTVPPTVIDAEKRLDQVIKNIAHEDTKIITASGCRVGIYNAEDSYIANEITKSNTVGDTKTFGISKSCDIYYGDYTITLEGCSFEFFLKDADKKQLLLTFTQYILPLEYREVFAAAILVGLETGLTGEQIKTSLEKHYELPQGRSSLLRGINNTSIIDSSYNASKASTIAFLDMVNTLKKKTNKKAVFLFGDMRELGEESELEHKTVAEKLRGIIDYLYLVGPQTREYIFPVIQEFEKDLKEVRWFDTATRAGEYLQKNLPKDTVVLVKGSQNSIFLEEAITYILHDRSDTKNLCRQSEFWLKIKHHSS